MNSQPTQSSRASGLNQSRRVETKRSVVVYKTINPTTKSSQSLEPVQYVSPKSRPILPSGKTEESISLTPKAQNLQESQARLQQQNQKFGDANQSYHITSNHSLRNQDYQSFVSNQQDNGKKKSEMHIKTPKDFSSNQSFTSAAFAQINSTIPISQQGNIQVYKNSNNPQPSSYAQAARQQQQFVQQQPVTVYQSVPVRTISQQHFQQYDNSAKLSIQAQQGKEIRVINRQGTGPQLTSASSFEQQQSPLSNQPRNYKSSQSLQPSQPIQINQAQQPEFNNRKKFCIPVDRVLAQQNSLKQSIHTPLQSDRSIPASKPSISVNALDNKIYVEQQIVSGNEFPPYQIQNILPQAGGTYQPILINKYPNNRGESAPPNINNYSAITSLASSFQPQFQNSQPNNLIQSINDGQIMNSNLNTSVFNVVVNDQDEIEEQLKRHRIESQQQSVSKPSYSPDYKRGIQNSNFIDYSYKKSITDKALATQVQQTKLEFSEYNNFDFLGKPPLADKPKDLKALFGQTDHIFHSEIAPVSSPQFGSFSQQPQQINISQAPNVTDEVKEIGVSEGRNLETKNNLFEDKPPQINANDLKTVQEIKPALSEISVQKIENLTNVALPQNYDGEAKRSSQRSSTVDPYKEKREEALSPFHSKLLEDLRQEKKVRESLYEDKTKSSQQDINSKILVLDYSNTKETSGSGRSVSSDPYKGFSSFTQKFEGTKPSLPSYTPLVDQKLTSVNLLSTQQQNHQQNTELNDFISKFSSEINKNNLPQTNPSDSVFGKEQTDIKKQETNKDDYIDELIKKSKQKPEEKVVTNIEQIDAVLKRQEINDNYIDDLIRKSKQEQEEKAVTNVEQIDVVPKKQEINDTYIDELIKKSKQEQQEKVVNEQTDAVQKKSIIDDDYIDDLIKRSKPKQEEKVQEEKTLEQNLPTTIQTEATSQNNINILYGGTSQNNINIPSNSNINNTSNILGSGVQMTDFSNNYSSNTNQIQSSQTNEILYSNNLPKTDQLDSISSFVGNPTSFQEKKEITFDKPVVEENANASEAELSKLSTADYIKLKYAQIVAADQRSKSEQPRPTASFQEEVKKSQEITTTITTFTTYQQPTFVLAPTVAIPTPVVQENTRVSQNITSITTQDILKSTVNNTSAYQIPVYQPIENKNYTELISQPNASLNVQYNSVTSPSFNAFSTTVDNKQFNSQPNPAIEPITVQTVPQSYQPPKPNSRQNSDEEVKRASKQTNGIQQEVQLTPVQQFENPQFTNGQQFNSIGYVQPAASNVVYERQNLHKEKLRSRQNSDEDLKKANLILEQQKQEIARKNSFGNFGISNNDLSGQVKDYSKSQLEEKYNSATTTTPIDNAGEKKRLREVKSVDHLLVQRRFVDPSLDEEVKGWVSPLFEDFIKKNFSGGSYNEAAIQEAIKRSKSEIGLTFQQRGGVSQVVIEEQLLQLIEQQKRLIDQQNVQIQLQNEVQKSQLYNNSHLSSPHINGNRINENILLLQQLNNSHSKSNSQLLGTLSSDNQLQYQSQQQMISQQNVNQFGYNSNPYSTLKSTHASQFTNQQTISNNQVMPNVSSISQASSIGNTYSQFPTKIPNQSNPSILNGQGIKFYMNSSNGGSIATDNHHRIVSYFDQVVEGQNHPEHLEYNLTDSGVHEEFQTNNQKNSQNVHLSTISNGVLASEQKSISPIQYREQMISPIQHLEQSVSPVQYREEDTGQNQIMAKEIASQYSQFQPTSQNGTQQQRPTENSLLQNLNTISQNVLLNQQGGGVNPLTQINSLLHQNSNQLYETQSNNININNTQNNKQQGETVQTQKYNPQQHLLDLNDIQHLDEELLLDDLTPFNNNNNNNRQQIQGRQEIDLRAECKDVRIEEDQLEEDFQSATKQDYNSRNQYDSSNGAGTGRGNTDRQSSRIHHSQSMRTDQGCEEVEEDYEQVPKYFSENNSMRDPRESNYSVNQKQSKFQTNKTEQSYSSSSPGDLSDRDDLVDVDQDITEEKHVKKSGKKAHHRLLSHENRITEESQSNKNEDRSQLTQINVNLYKNQVQQDNFVVGEYTPQKNQNIDTNESVSQSASASPIPNEDRQDTIQEEENSQQSPSQLEHIQQYESSVDHEKLDNDEQHKQGQEEEEEQEDIIATQLQESKTEQLKQSAQSDEKMSSSQIKRLNIPKSQSSLSGQKEGMSSSTSFNSQKKKNRKSENFVSKGSDSGNKNNEINLTESGQLRKQMSNQEMNRKDSRESQDSGTFVVFQDIKQHVQDRIQKYDQKKGNKINKDDIIIEDQNTARSNESAPKQNTKAKKQIEDKPVKVLEDSRQKSPQNIFNILSNKTSTLKRRIEKQSPKDAQKSQLSKTQQSTESNLKVSLVKKSDKLESQGSPKLREKQDQKKSEVLKVSLIPSKTLGSLSRSPKNNSRDIISLKQSALAERQQMAFNASQSTVRSINQSNVNSPQSESLQATLTKWSEGHEFNLTKQSKQSSKRTNKKDDSESKEQKVFVLHKNATFEINKPKQQKSVTRQQTVQTEVKPSQFKKQQDLERKNSPSYKITLSTQVTSERASERNKISISPNAITDQELLKKEQKSKQNKPSQGLQVTITGKSVNQQNASVTSNKKFISSNSLDKDSDPNTLNLYQRYQEKKIQEKELVKSQILERKKSCNSNTINATNPNISCGSHSNFPQQEHQTNMSMKSPENIYQQNQNLRYEQQQYLSNQTKSSNQQQQQQQLQQQTSYDTQDHQLFEQQQLKQSQQYSQLVSSQNSQQSEKISQSIQQHNELSLYKQKQREQLEKIQLKLKQEEEEYQILINSQSQQTQPTPTVENNNSNKTGKYLSPQKQEKKGDKKDNKLFINSPNTNTASKNLPTNISQQQMNSQFSSNQMYTQDGPYTQDYEDLLYQEYMRDQRDQLIQKNIQEGVNSGQLTEDQQIYLQELDKQENRVKFQEFMKRNQEWVTEKERKIKEQQLQKEVQEMSECTFKPLINLQSPTENRPVYVPSTKSSRLLEEQTKMKITSSQSSLNQIPSQKSFRKSHQNSRVGSNSQIVDFESRTQLPRKISNNSNKLSPVLNYHSSPPSNPTLIQSNERAVGDKQGSNDLKQDIEDVLGIISGFYSNQK